MVLVYVIQCFINQGNIFAVIAKITNRFSSTVMLVVVNSFELNVFALSSELSIFIITSVDQCRIGSKIVFQPDDAVHF